MIALAAGTMLFASPGRAQTPPAQAQPPQSQQPAVLQELAELRQRVVELEAHSGRQDLSIDRASLQAKSELIGETRTLREKVAALEARLAEARVDDAKLVLMIFGPLLTLFGIAGGFAVYKLVYERLESSLNASVTSSANTKAEIGREITKIAVFHTLAERYWRWYSNLGEEDAAQRLHLLRFAHQVTNAAAGLVLEMERGVLSSQKIQLEALQRNHCVEALNQCLYNSVELRRLSPEAEISCPMPEHKLAERVLAEANEARENNERKKFWHTWIETVAWHNFNFADKALGLGLIGEVLKDSTVPSEFRARMKTKYGLP